MKNILYFSVLLFNTINICSAGIVIDGYLVPAGVDEYEIVIDDATAFSVDMTSPLFEASVWLFDDSGDLTLEDQFWIDGFPSVFPGDLSAGDEGNYTLAISIFGVEPEDITDPINLSEGWYTDAANPGDEGDYSVTIEGASLYEPEEPAPAPPPPAPAAPAAKQIPTLSEWGMILMSAFLGLTVFARQRKLI